MKRVFLVLQKLLLTLLIDVLVFFLAFLCCFKERHLQGQPVQF